MLSPFARSRRLAATILLALSCGCTGSRDREVSGEAGYTEADMQHMKFIGGFRNALGQPCREFEQDVVISGHKAGATSAICQQPDGRWTFQR
jgi:hypothetical protein